MINLAGIERIARDIVNANTTPDAVVSVAVKPSVDWTGDPVLAISVVIRPEAEKSLTGKAPLDILTGISDGLQAVGEERFPIIDYATTAELEAANAASES